MDLPDEPEAAGDAEELGSEQMKENLVAIWGADVDQLRQLGNKLKAGAENIEQQRSQLKGALDGTDWKGPDADKFRSEWDSQHASNLKKVADALREAGDRAQKNAEQQQQASN